MYLLRVNWEKLILTHKSNLKTRMKKNLHHLQILRLNLIKQDPSNFNKCTNKCLGQKTFFGLNGILMKFSNMIFSNNNGQFRKNQDHNLNFFSFPLSLIYLKDLVCLFLVVVIQRTIFLKGQFFLADIKNSLKNHRWYTKELSSLHCFVFLIHVYIHLEVMMENKI